MSHDSFELETQQRSWSKAEFEETDRVVLGRPGVPITQVWAGGMSFSLQEHQNTMKAQLGTERKTMSPKGFRGGVCGKERCGERRVHKCFGIDLTLLPLTGAWGG